MEMLVLQIALALFPVTFLFLGSFAGFSIPLRELPEGRSLMSCCQCLDWKSC